MSAELNRWPSVMMANYGTPQVLLTKGQGSRVWDSEGREYVDLVAGIAVSALGHAHPGVIAAATKQLQTLGHTSNLVAHRPGLELAETLLELCGVDGRVFFCNSGAEANEAAFKMSRLTGRTRVVSLTGSFHGRTAAALAMTGQPAKREAFEPLVPGIEFIDPDDIEALEAIVSDRTAAVWLEPIQGEGGVRPLSTEFLQAARAACDRTGALLVFDEVQTGIARTGTWFAWQSAQVQPDILLLAKGLGGGLPIGAVIGFGPAGALLQPGSHGSTFGGNPAICAAALAVIDEIKKDGLDIRAIELEHRIRAALEPLAQVCEIRGRGLMLGVVLRDVVASEVQERLRNRGVLVNAIGTDVLRLVPALNISQSDLDFALAAMAAELG